MKEDLEIDENDPNCPLNAFNIQWLLRRVLLKSQGAVKKVPFLAAMIKSINHSHHDATALIKDKTGNSI